MTESVWIVYSEAPYEGQDLHGVFATEGDAKSWADSVGLTDREYVAIVEWRIGETDYYYTPESWAAEQGRRKERKAASSYFVRMPDWMDRLNPVDVPMIQKMGQDSGKVTWGWGVVDES